MAPRKKIENLAEVTTNTAAAGEKETAKKTTRAKAPAEKKAATAKKAPAKEKKAEVEFFVQWWGKEVTEKEIVERIQTVWTEEMGKKATELKELKVYVKPEENLAHYVINGEITGHIEI